MSKPGALGHQGKCELRQTGGVQFGVLGLLKSKLATFKEDIQGDVAMVFGLTFVIMTVFVGGAVDFGRWLHASKQTKTAIDAAVLAGGRIMQVQGTTATAINNAKIAASKYYVENTKTRLPVVNDTVNFNVTADKTGFTASGNAYIKTPILAVLNLIDGQSHTELKLLSGNAADYSVAKLKVGGNAEHNLEISMMLDTSGSMAGQKLVDMKAAAKDLIDIVVWDDQSAYTSKVSIAPFSADVRLPDSMNPGARGATPVATKTLGGYTYKLTPCVAERIGVNKYTDVAPSAGNYVMAKYTLNSNSCSQGLNNAVVPLNNNKTTLKNAVDGLSLGGGTAGHLGTAWAWYTISPNWASIYPGSSQPAAYGTDKLDKIAILMTDGEYNEEYTSQGATTGSSGAGNTPANGTSVVQAKALCDGMKAKGITVYTVGFDLGGNATAIATLGYCATDASHFYQATNGDQLKEAFRDIALKISDLYLSK